MTLSDRLNSTASIKRNVRTTNSKGGFTYASTAVAGLTSVSCRISMVRASEIGIGDSVRGETFYKIFTLSSTANDGIVLHDLFVVGSLEYEVIGISNPSKGQHIEFNGVIKYRENDA